MNSQTSYLAADGRRRVWLQRGLLIVLWLAAVIAWRNYQTSNDLSPAGAAQDFIDRVETAWWGVLAFVGVYLARPVVLFPASILTVVGGVLFGPVVGVIVVIVAANSSAMVAYSIGRLLGRTPGSGDVTQDDGSPSSIVERWSARLRENSFETVLVMRFLFLPYDLVSYAAGALRIRWVPFLTATALGSLPGTVSFVLLGASLERVDQGLSGIEPVYIVVGVILFVISLVIARLVKRRQARFDTADVSATPPTTGGALHLPADTGDEYETATGETDTGETDTGETDTGETDTGDVDEVPLAGGSLNAGQVMRVGNTVRRPRGRSAELHEAVLLHLEAVGFDAAPRFVGIDESGRQILSFIDGDVREDPPWQTDDDANARALGALAALARRAHDALAGFVPPDGVAPMFGIPGPGETWNHADIGYHNAVYRVGAPIALIDWEAVAAGDELYDPASLVAMSARGPRSDRPEELDDRIAATQSALAAVADGFGMSEAQFARFPDSIAAMLDHTADVWTAIERPAVAIAALRWKATWFTEHADLLR